MMYFSFFNILNEMDDNAVVGWLEAHPDIMVDNFGVTALAEAVREGRLNLVEQIQKKNLSPDRSIMSSALGSVFQCRFPEKSTTILRILLKNKYPIESESPAVARYAPELNEPLIHAAIRRRRKDLLKILLDAGGNLDLCDSDGATGWDLIKIYIPESNKM